MREIVEFLTALPQSISCSYKIIFTLKERSNIGDEEKIYYQTPTTMAVANCARCFTSKQLSLGSIAP